MFKYFIGWKVFLKYLFYFQSSVTNFFSKFKGSQFAQLTYVGRIIVTKCIPASYVIKCIKLPLYSRLIEKFNEDVVEANFGRERGSSK